MTGARPGDSLYSGHSEREGEQKCHIMIINSLYCLKSILNWQDLPLHLVDMMWFSWWQCWHSLLCTWAWPGLGGVQRRQQWPVLAMSSGCPLAPMAWTWAQSQLRLRAQSHDTRARAHWGRHCDLATLIMCLLALTTVIQPLCANMSTCDQHSGVKSEKWVLWQKVK